MTATAQQLANREKWRAALLSGEYEQATDALRVFFPNAGTYGYCCIGVALDVLGEGRWLGNGEDGDEGTYRQGDDFDAVDHQGDMAGHTFKSLFGTFGFDTSHLAAEVNDDVREECVFITANDKQGKTFAQIADMIPLEDS